MSGVARSSGLDSVFARMAQIDGRMQDLFAVREAVSTSGASAAGTAGAGTFADALATASAGRTAAGSATGAASRSTSGVTPASAGATSVKTKPPVTGALPVPPANAGTTATGAATGGSTSGVSGAGSPVAAVTARPVTPAPIGASGPSGPAAPTGDGTFRSPLPAGRISQAFGPTSYIGEPAATVNGVHYDHYHDGLDLAAPLGTPVVAAAAGRVTLAGRVTDGAVVVVVEHADGTSTLYGHLQDDLAVRVGDTVTAGQTLGTIGMTGNTTGPHLHFELRSNGLAIDPTTWLAAGQLPGRVAQASIGPAIPPADLSGDGLATPAALEAFDGVKDTFPFGQQIRDAAGEAGVDPFLLASLVQAESNFNAGEHSTAGAMGLTQLMPETARSLRVTDPYDPAENLAGGAKYLASDLRIFGRVDLALAAYQAGKGAVRAAGGIPDSATTRAYIARIGDNWTTYLHRAGA